MHHNSYTFPPSQLIIILARSESESVHSKYQFDTFGFLILSVINQQFQPFTIAAVSYYSVKSCCGDSTNINFMIIFDCHRYSSTYPGVTSLVKIFEYIIHMEFFDLLQKDSTEFMEYYVYVFKLFTRPNNEFPISLL